MPPRALDEWWGAPAPPPEGLLRVAELAARLADGATRQAGRVVLGLALQPAPHYFGDGGSDASLETSADEAIARSDASGASRTRKSVRVASDAESDVICLVHIHVERAAGVAHEAPSSSSGRRQPWWLGLRQAAC